MLAPAYTALALYALWTVALLLALVSVRGLWVLSGQRAIDSFPADSPHPGPAWYQRLNRAHLNCVENLPVFAALILLAGVLGQLEPANLVAPWVLLARVMQTLLHLLTVRPWVIWLRVTALLVQQMLMVGLGLRLLGWL